VIAALYVERAGVYYDMPDVDPWDEERDARRYAGPWPVVAHPPCARWGRYWYGGPSVTERRTLGDDDGCFSAAVAAVRRWGGVLEHPEASHAWGAHGNMRPQRGGGWSWAGDGIGWTCCVEQGHYGHRARKATWLYAVGCELPVLRWGPSVARVRLDREFHTAEERRMFMRPPPGMSQELRDRRRQWLRVREAATGKVHCGPERMGRRERMATPLPFRDLLLSMARTVASDDTLTKVATPAGQPTDTAPLSAHDHDKKPNS
jgi:hypothetical protein